LKVRWRRHFWSVTFFFIRRLSLLIVSWFHSVFAIWQYAFGADVIFYYTDSRVRKLFERQLFLDISDLWYHGLSLWDAKIVNLGSSKDGMT
jgi:hypothetical protein